MRNLLSTVGHMHGKGWVHRDLKPENMMLETKQSSFDNIDFSEVKLIDFGTAVRHKEGDAPLTETMGTADFIAPEVLLESYDSRCDIWSIGCLAHMMLSGSPPFIANSEELVFAAIK